MKEKPYSIWNYSVLGRFNKNVFGNLMTINELESKHEEMVKIDDMVHYGYYFYIPNEKRLYFFDSVDKKNDNHILDMLPVQIQSSVKKSYRNKVFYHVKKYGSFKIIPKKIITFKEIVDELSKIEHEKPEELKLWTIIVLTTYLDKVMLRICSPKGFGKDSIARILKALVNGIAVAKPRTIAKLEYLLAYTQALYINEMSTANKEQRQLIEDFILQVGDFSTDYQKGSRATKHGSKEVSDTEMLSLIFMYNDLDHYTDKSMFFDNLFNNEATYDRLLHLRFSGRIDVDQFHNQFDVEKASKDHQQEYIDMLKSIEYYKYNYRNELKDYQLKREYPLSERHKKSFMKIIEFINLYSESETEFDTIVNSLFKAYRSYQKMNKEVTGLDVYDEGETVIEQQPDGSIEEFINKEFQCKRCNTVTNAVKVVNDNEYACEKCGELVIEL